jgi:hypothetical protein
MSILELFKLRLSLILTFQIPKSQAKLESTFKELKDSWDKSSDSICILFTLTFAFLFVFIFCC